MILVGSVPEAFGSLAVAGLRLLLRAGVAVEILAGVGASCGVGDELDDRRGTLLRTAQQWPQDAKTGPHRSGEVPHETGGHDAGVDGEGSQPAIVRASMQFVGEQDVGQLGRAVGPNSAPVVLEVEVVQRHRFDALVDARADVDDSGIVRLKQLRQQQRGEQDVREVIRLHHRLVAVIGERSVIEREPSVVDQDIEPFGAFQQFVGGSSDGGKRGQVQL